MDEGRKMELCENCHDYIENICTDCVDKYNVCLNCVFYGQPCLNCEEDEGLSLDDLP